MFIGRFPPHFKYLNYGYFITDLMILQVGKCVVTLTWQLIRIESNDYIQIYNDILPNYSSKIFTFITCGGNSAMRLNNYHVENEDQIISPQMIYYKDEIIQNTKRSIELAGGDVNRLWVHVKTHKTRELIEMQVSMGIKRFKCATISEAEITAESGAKEILVSYALVGPNIKRFVNISKALSGTVFWAMGDDIGQMQLLSDVAVKENIVIPTLVDLDVGQSRTGTPIETIIDFYKEASALSGLKMRGFHCYDGQNHQIGFDVRKAACKEIAKKVEDVKSKIAEEGLFCDTIIIGGTPSAPCYVDISDYYISPGTIFVYDGRYAEDYPELEAYEAAAILTRVISHPSPQTFTLDLGTKGISCDQYYRGKLVGVEAESQFQHEEHWLWKMKEGFENRRPAIGDVLYVIPAHVCPSTVLYDSVLVAEGGKITDKWQIAAKKRKLTY